MVVEVVKREVSAEALLIRSLATTYRLARCIRRLRLVLLLLFDHP